MANTTKISFWTKGENDILTANRKNSTIPELVALLNSKGYSRSRGAVERRCRRMGLQFESSNSLVKGVVEATKVKPITKVELRQIELQADAEVQWARMEEMAKEFKDYPINRTRGFAKPTRRIVSLSDIHMPFHREDSLKEAVERAKGADILVLNGDIFDCYGISTFKKNKRIPLIREYMIVLEFLKGLVKHFPTILLVSGNHEERFSGTLNTALQVTCEPPVGDDLMTRLARGDIYNEDGELIGNYAWDNVHYDPLQSWWVKVGKTIFCHPRTFSRGPGHTIKKAYDWFYQIDHVGEWDSIVMGHTHQVAKYVYEGKLLIEQGCLTNILEYQWNSNIQYIGQSNGFAEIYQDSNGNTNYTKSDVVYLGQQHAPTQVKEY